MSGNSQIQIIYFFSRSDRPDNYPVFDVQFSQSFQKMAIVGIKHFRRCQYQNSLFFSLQFHGQFLIYLLHTPYLYEYAITFRFLLSRLKTPSPQSRQLHSGYTRERHQCSHRGQGSSHSPVIWLIPVPKLPCK